jgi:hypothetical protein
VSDELEGTCKKEVMTFLRLSEHLPERQNTSTIAEILSRDLRIIQQERWLLNRDGYIQPTFISQQPSQKKERKMKWTGDQGEE